MSYTLCSIVICTYRRPDKLWRCLSSLIKELENTILPAEILVIDNSPAEEAKEVIELFKAHAVRMRYIHEPVTGLAYARNRGIEEAKGNYIFYLDDDAWVEEGFAKRLFDTMTGEDYDAFGSFVKGYTPKNAPEWLKTAYYHPLRFMNKRGLLQTGYLHGGASAYKTDVLHLLGGYDTDLGMRGTEIGYGEDTELEKRLRKKGFRIGYDPELVVHHEIQYDTIDKLCRSYYLRTKTFYTLYEERLSGRVLWSVAASCFQALKAFIKGGLLLLFQESYYLQNWYLETIFPLLKAMAILQVGGPQYLRRDRLFFRRDRHFNTMMRYFGRTVKGLQFVQIGACDGISFDPVNKWINQYKWEGVVVEPLPHLVKELEQTYASEPGVKVVSLAISDRDGMAEMQYVETENEEIPEWVKGVASLEPERNALNPRFRLNEEWKQYIKKTQVKTLSWPTFLETYKLKNIDLLVLDTEGMEFRILGQIKNMPPLVLFEFSNLPVNELRAVFKMFSTSHHRYFFIQISDTDIFAIRQDYLTFALRTKMNLPWLNTTGL